MNLQGNWTGVLTYGKEYRQNAGKQLYFVMELTQDGAFFSGTARDTGGKGVNPEPARIDGSIQGETVSFIKQYPTLHYQDLKGKSVIDTSKKGPEIAYTGVFNADGTVISGTWTIEYKFTFFGMVLWRTKTVGNWEMKREDSQKPESGT